MICNRCGATVSNGQKFCMRCGAPVPREAPQPGYSPYSARQAESRKTKKTRTLLIILVIVLWAAVLGMVGYLVLSGGKEKPVKETQEEPAAEEPAAPTNTDVPDEPLTLEELVTDAYFDDSLSDGYGYGIIMIPKINLDSAEIEVINREIYATFYTNQAANWTRGEPVGSIRYYKAMKDDILSLLIEYSRAENEFRSYAVYNVSISGKRSISDSDLVSHSSVIDYNDTVKRAMEAWFYKAFNGSVDRTDQGACEWYNQQLDATRSYENVRQSMPYFDESGELCAAVQIYPMAASTNWTTVKLESFDYDSRYADYIEYEEIELPIPSTKNDYMIADSDKRLITEKELSTLSENECWLVLDEIYARHGRIFGVEWVAAHFNSKPWYHGTIPGEVFDANLDKYMNEYEKRNIDIVADYMRKMGWHA